jgi:hypothetical protein
VLRGLTATLERGGIREILFEDQGEDPTPIYRLLEERGYRLFSLGVDFLGPHLCPLASGRAGSALGFTEYVGDLGPGSGCCTVGNPRLALSAGRSMTVPDPPRRTVL